MRELTPLERDLQSFIEDGGDEQSLLDHSRSTIRMTAGQVLVTYADEQGETQELDISELAPVTGLRTAFADIIAQRVHEGPRNSLENELIKLFKFVTFLEEEGISHLSVEGISNALLTSYSDWLNDFRTPPVTGRRPSRHAMRRREGGKPLSTTYKREVYRVLVNYLRRIRLLDLYAGRFDPALDLHASQTWKPYGRRKPASILTRPQLKMLVRLCREEVAETTRRLHAYWAICDGTATADDLALVDPEVAAELRTMQAAFGQRASSAAPEPSGELHAAQAKVQGLPPSCRDDFRSIRPAEPSPPVTESQVEFTRRTCPRLWAMNGPEYQEAISLLYPNPRRILPFCLLFGVYFRYNPSVLAGLKRADLKMHPGAVGERIHGAPFKNRAGRKQHASWPVTKDAHNPAVMLETIERWTASIRGHEPEQERGHLFLYRNQTRGVRSFAVVHAYDRPLAKFIKEHGAKLPTSFTIRSIRPSVIDLVHHLFDGDVVAASHAGHHRRVDTTIEHYLYDGARKRNDEALVPVVHSMNRWIETGGVVDPRNSGSGSYLGATPGWECADPYLGAIAGEAPDELCRAYGRCPTCELGKVNRNSPVSFALNVKLREAVLRARTSMAEHAWLKRWQPVADLLDRTIELSFTAEAKELSDLDIPDLPTVE